MNEKIKSKLQLVLPPQKTTDKIHQSHPYRVRDIPLSSFDVFLLVNGRQFRCKNCKKVLSEELNFVKFCNYIHAHQCHD
ncbi:MAG: transposase [Okeania sp. SIO2C2]|uniref:transposase family protein n=2 Tax=Okeania sp. SIO2C2 TaxID=2607787 RepID=UPI0013B76A3E|nr:transposase [Okeania sp. SIO2C2]